MFFVTLTKWLENIHTIHGERHMVNTVIVSSCSALFFSTSQNKLTWEMLEGDINGYNQTKPKTTVRVHGTFKIPFI